MSCITVLKEKGFKLTPQRRLILEYIHDHQSHITAEDILKYLDSRAPGVDKSTVYRTLDLLEESGCVVKSEVSGHFIYHHTEDGHHHHLVCRSCGRTIDCHEDLFSDVTNALLRQYGFQADLKHLMLSGTCRRCREEL
jgi:Fur family ferric uptake transcriptional regulator